jgi:hypothetical protein
MNATKILWGQIFLVCAVVVGFIWGATEWTAWQLAFQPQLGHPWFTLFGWPVYQPPAFFWWWFAYDAYAHEIFVTGGFIAGAGGVAAFVVAVAMSVWRAREVKKVTTYGSARWAEGREIRKAGLLHPDGVLLGRWRGAYLRHFGPEHVLCFAPTRSGKGVGLVVPTLLTWPGSAIVHDIKGENWGLTAGWRARFGNVLLFDPTNTKSAAYNPLLEVRRGEWEVRDVQNIADVLVDPEGALEKRNHWEKTSHSLLVGTILHVLYAEKDKTLAGVANFLSDPKRPIETTLRAMMATRHLGKAGVHPVVASAARELLNKSENERSGVLSTALSFLGLYRDPVVAAVTARCDWRIRDLVEAEHPVTLYLVLGDGLAYRPDAKLHLRIVEMKRRRAAGNIQEASDFPCGFPLRGPFQAFELSRRQRDAINHPIDRQPSAYVCMKIHRHELQHAPILLDAALECRAAFVRGESDRSDRTTGVADGHCEATADPELRRLVEQRALWCRKKRRREFLSPLERLCAFQRLDNDRIDPLIVFPQIMIGPLDRVVRDEFRRIAPSRRHGKIRETAQIERRARIGEHGTETLGVAAGGKAVDKRLEHTMHAVTPVSHKQVFIEAVPGRGKFRAFSR